jgi:hypothetical protein
VASTPDPPAGERLAGADGSGEEYAVGAVLRHGWGGVIREGSHLRTGRRVTVEDIREDLVSDPGLVERLAEAGRAAAALRDPHLVAVYDLVGDDAGYHMVAEWTGAPSLAEVLRRGWFGAERGTAIVEDVLAALSVLHAAGLVHGQVGADTVVVEAQGPARLAELAVCAGTATAAGGRQADVRDAARLGLHLLSRSGSRAAALRRVLDEAVSSGSADAAGLRRDLDGAAAADLGAGWRDRAAAVQPLPAATRRRLLIAALVALLALGAAVGAGILFFGSQPAAVVAPAPLLLGSDAMLAVMPERAGCDTTFVFVARGSVSGTGSLVYRWEQSDGEVTSDTAVVIRANEGAFQLTQAWRLQGSQTFNGAMTLHILKPVDRRLRQSFRYVCP